MIELRQKCKNKEGTKRVSLRVSEICFVVQSEVDEGCIVGCRFVQQSDLCSTISCADSYDTVSKLIEEEQNRHLNRFVKEK